MNARRILFFVLVSCFVQPATAWTQADTGNIVGIVKDISGAVLPGVAVEAASPALIEKIRTTSATSRAATESATCGPASIP
jgi:hypothetical protein